jgi:GT2 family glycosyltransferase
VTCRRRPARDSLVKQTVVPHIVVIDNHSTDESPDIIAKEYPAVELVRNDRNYDFGTAYNRAIKPRKEEFVVILNNDIVMEPDCIENALKFLENTPEAGAAVFIVYEMDQPVKFPYDRDYILKKRFGVDLGTHVRFESKDSKPRWMRYIWGGGSMLRRKLFDEIQFDEDFGWYWEDADLGWMMVNRTKYRPAAVPGAIVHHIGGASVKKRFKNDEANLMDHRNALLSFEKNATAWELLRSWAERRYFFKKQPDKEKLLQDMKRKREKERVLPK